MPAQRAHPLGDAAVPQGRLDWALEAVLAALLLFSPLAYGATEAWSQFVALVLVAALLGLTLARLFVDRHARVISTWAFVPIVLFLALITLQLLPLPASVVRLISPAATATRGELLGASAAEAWQTLSLYPHATARDLRLLMAVAVVFFVVLQHYRTTDRVVRLLVTLTLSGLLVGGLAAFQNFTGATTVYGLVPMPHPMSGPFMNHSHFGQFMNLCVGAALGLLLMALRSEAIERAGGPRRPGLLAARNRQRVIMLCVVVVLLGAATIALSMTRMGVLSGLLAAGIVGALYVARARERGRGTLVVTLGLLVLAALLVAGFDAIFARVATVGDISRAEGGRTQILADILPAVKKFPVFGTGLGTFEFVFPGFDRSGQSTLATHAENEYAQTLQETGATGLACVIAFVIVIAAAWFRVIWRPERPSQHAAFGLGYGLLAIAIHSASDFGQHVPANAFVTATCCAATLALARRQHPQSAGEPARVPSRDASKLPAGFRYPATACAVVLAWFGLSAAWRASEAEGHARVAAAVADGLAARDWQGTDDDYRELLRPAGEAAALQPGDVRYAYDLNIYRWRTLTRGPASVERETLLRRVADELLAARTLCPTFGPLYNFAGRLRFDTPGDDAAVTLIRTGARLAPHDPNAAFTIGLIDLSEGDVAAARDEFDRAIRLGTPKLDVIDVMLENDRPDDAYALAAGDRAALDALSARFNAKNIRPDLAVRIKAESDALLLAAASAEDADAGLLGTAAEHAERTGDRPIAINFYLRALRRNYARPEWHLSVARLLAAEGRDAEALDAAKAALRLRPGWPDAERLLAEWTAAEDAARRAAATRPSTRSATQRAAATRPAGS